MNISALPIHRSTLVATAVAFALFAGCSSAPSKPDGAENLRTKLTHLQNNPELASRAPLAMKEADLAVQAAEKRQNDKVLAAHLVFIADRKIDTAQAQAESRLAMDQRKGLAEQREAMRLQARTQEADSANRRAAVAQTESGIQKREADLARSQAEFARNASADAQRDANVARGQAESARDATLDAQRDANAARDASANAQRDADAARNATADAQRKARELQAQMDELQAKETDRGLVVTLGDVLFATGTANLNGGSNKHLSKLAAFLSKYPNRSTVIEGYTDSIGSEEYNQGLSQRRADAVKAYLTDHGVSSRQLTASGKGESSPVGDNGTVTGRQQNRRVEVIIEKEMVSSR